MRFVIMGEKVPVPTLAKNVDTMVIKQSMSMVKGEAIGLNCDKRNRTAGLPAPTSNTTSPVAGFVSARYSATNFFALFNIRCPVFRLNGSINLTEFLCQPVSLLLKLRDAYRHQHLNFRTCKPIIPGSRLLDDSG